MSYASVIEEAVKVERERCAKIAEEMANSAMRNNDGWLGHRMIPLEIAKRIRRAEPEDVRDNE